MLFPEKSKDAGVEIQNCERDDLDLPLFDLPTLHQATENFAKKNKIGQGGFRPVYWVIQWLNWLVHFINITVSIPQKFKHAGEVTKWTGNCCEEAFKIDRTWIKWIQKWSEIYCQTLASKSCKTSWLLHSGLRKVVGKWVHAK